MLDGVAAYRAHGAECIVAVGGGSPLDTGKLIALKVTHDRPLVDYDDAVDGGHFIGPNVPPIVTIPTTAGTAARSAARASSRSPRRAARPSSSARTCWRRWPLLDPELTRSMPARVTAATGFDALTHCLEAYCSLGDHPMADAIALGGLELCAATPGARGRARRRSRGARRHDEGRDDGRGRVPEGPRRVPLAGAPALEREGHAPRARQRALPARGRRVQRGRGARAASSASARSSTRRREAAARPCARSASASACPRACAPRAWPRRTSPSWPTRPSRTRATAATRGPSRATTWPRCTAPRL